MTSDLMRRSGPWRGFWVQGRYRANMSLTLLFANAAVHGNGSDAIGRFSIRGEVALETQDVSFLKLYGSHVVHYDGLWDGQMITGVWHITYGRYQESGSFELWPSDGADDAIAQIEQLAEAELPMRR